MRSSCFPPLAAWLLVAVTCGLVIGASFAYAGQVGESTKQEDARREADRRNRRGGVVSTNPTGTLPSASSAPRRSRTMAALDASLPPADCSGTLVADADEPTITFDALERDWEAATRCATASGTAPIDVGAFTSDVTTRQCAVAYLAMTTVTLRDPGTARQPFAFLLSQCTDVPLVLGPSAGGSPGAAGDGSAGGVSPVSPPPPSGFPDAGSGAP